ncbi:MAG: hypothetical protein QXV42_01300 [Ignisphaera sp.]
MTNGLYLYMVNCVEGVITQDPKPWLDRISSKESISFLEKIAEYVFG